MTIALPPTRISAEAVAAINEVLKRRLRPYGFERADIQPGQDFEGDPVIFVEAHYRLSKKPFDVKEFQSARSETIRTLRALGEYRFPHISNHFAQGQRILRTRDGHAH